MRDFKIYISIASILLLVYLVAQYNKPNPINWSKTLYYNDKIPFGTYIIYNQLNDIFPGAIVTKTNASLYTTFHDSTIKPGNYLVIARNIHINKDDYNQLVKYVKAGNSVFLSASSFTGFIADTLKIEVNEESKGKFAELNFANGNLKQAKNYVFGSDIANNYFDDFDTTRATVIGTNNYQHSTFISFSLGKGKLYLCANPCIFTNYSLLKGNNAGYAAKALSYLSKAKNIYWDEFQNGDIPEEQSPVRFFFTHPALQWAYYLSLCGLIIFILFEIKRRQRIIPVIDPLTNSTLEFVNVVGQVYYEKRDNANIAHKKIAYFLSHLRDGFQVKTNNFNDEFVEKLTTKIGLELAFAQQLTDYLQYIANQTKVTDHELIKLNKLIEQFYIKSR
ncbi:DUF4350 domain-containing protein [Mucilaginibacter sp. X4EP1]|uniref:DUF4350 domain-containing protein n=1 Tax=Mucilaginibacter sp. X4EP1 TaxID=2723092 RepID=UPI0021685F54|nr:DUF4350 domain-containing protein [Mucilaginibacter sp. X4EP1]MCS3813938.1 hypothetical protein [Mucilaginibacter sp. X4EP1]